MSGKVIVIGGGASGMMAAIAAAEQGASVTILEKNEKLGKKIYITGKGRCNVTNACDREQFFSKIVSNPRFLYSSFYDFSNQDMMALLERMGCPLKTERGQRVFPVSDHASDITRALTTLLKRLKVNIQLDSEALSIHLSGQIGVDVRHRGGKREETVFGDAVILATGGLSYTATGSTGDGIRMARELGHKITALTPSLVPFTTKEDVSGLMGLALRNVEVVIREEKKEVFREFGEMLFTHFGVSGPLILTASARAGARLSRGPLQLRINLKPALTPEQLDQRILRDFGEEKNRAFRNSLGKLLPSGLVALVVERSGIDPDKQVNAVTRQERRRLAEVIQGLDFTLTGLRGFNEAIVTRGGVSVKEVNPSTLESRKCAGLFFAGEMLDLDAETGGFNLQIAWSTGHLAGKSAAARAKEGLPDADKEKLSDTDRGELPEVGGKKLSGAGKGEIWR